jgi:hypothetical protein
VGAFRFCMGCQFDFDNLTAAGASTVDRAAPEPVQPAAASVEPAASPISSPNTLSGAAAETAPAWGVPAVRVDGQTTLRPASRSRRMSKRTMVVGGIAALLAVGAIGAAAKDQDPTSAGALATSSPTARPSPTPTNPPVALASPIAATPVPTVEPTPEPTLAPTPEPTPVPTARRRSIKQMVDSATKVSYKELFRNSDKYLLDAVYFKGEVIQVLDDGSGSYTLRVNVTKGEYGWWDDTVLLQYEGDRVLVDDIVDFVGISTGPYTYESVLGGDITVPAIDVTVDNQSFLRVIG